MSETKPKQEKNTFLGTAFYLSMGVDKNNLNAFLPYDSISLHEKKFDADLDEFVVDEGSGSFNITNLSQSS